MKKEVILFGYSKIGAKIATILKLNDYEVIIVDPDEKLYKEAIALGYTSFNYNLMKDEELIEVGIQKELKAFFCVSSSDKDNLFVTLSARNLNNNVKIISTAKTKSESKKMILAGANKIINQHELGALRIFRLLHKPLLLELFDNIVFSDSNLSIAEFTIDEHSSANGIYFKDFDYPKDNNILILGLADKELGDNFIFNSQGINHKLDTGDTIVAVGYEEELEKFRNYIEGESI